MSGRYDDIVNLPHHVSAKHPQMSLHDRAAQFAPFAALTGYGDAVSETARLTGDRIELDEDAKKLINERLGLLADCLSDKPEVTVTYFVPDERKSGGEYVTENCYIKKIDEFERAIITYDGEKIMIEDIYVIDSPLFGKLS